MPYDEFKEAAEQAKAEGLKSNEVETKETPENKETLEAKPEKKVETTEKVEPEKIETELTPEQVSAFIEKDEKFLLDLLKGKLQKDKLDSFKDLIETREVEKVIEKEPELPQSVKDFWDYESKTGNGIEGYMQAKKDWTAVPKDSVVMEYIQQVEGYDSETAKEYFDLKFNLNEDEYTEREVKMAKLDKEKYYNTALKYFNEQKKQFDIPNKDKELQRQAEEKAKEDRLLFAQGMTSAVNKMDSLTIGEDFSYNIPEKDGLADNFQSIEAIIKPYQSDKGFDYASLAADLYAGRHRNEIAKAYSDSVLAKYIEDEAKELTNHKDKTIPEAQSSGGSEDQKLQDAAKKIFGNY